MLTLPDFDPADFSAGATIDNPYFPLPAGTVSSYSATAIDPETGESGGERNDFYATAETKTITGVEAVVVRDTAYEDGVLIEDTLDWFAQDDAGNVWYLGEFTIAYEYDHKDDFAGTSTEGSWEAGVDGALPGWIMQAPPLSPGDPDFQEFSAGVAEDVGQVVATGLTVDGHPGVVQTLDTSQLEPGVIEYKYYAPGLGQVRGDEEIDATGTPQLVFHLDGIRSVTRSGGVDPADLAFGGDGNPVTVTFLTEDGDENTAIGSYLFDPATGEIAEGRMLFADTEDTQAGASVTVDVPAGMSLGLFMVPGADDLGVELEDFAEGGLYFVNFATGGAANIADALAPLVTDADGDFLPIRAFHSVGNRAGFNLLNPVGGENVLASDAGNGFGAEVVSFEEGLAGTDGFDGDFDDAFVAISAAELIEDDLDGNLDGIDISRLVGSDRADRLAGTEDDDQIVGLDGKDRLSGGGGDDAIQGGDGKDIASGGAGDDEISGDEGNDRLFGNDGDDEISGGEGNDRLSGGAGDDLLEGDEGRDILQGGAGYDTMFGGEGNDRLWAGADGARMSGGAGNDLLHGEAGVPDTFVFDLVPFGFDVIMGFEDGTDRVEIATYTGVTGFADIEVGSEGGSALLSFAEGTVRIDGLDADLVTADDFVFV